MVSEITLEAKKRTHLGKGAARQLRREGRIPITVYGGEEQSALSLSVDKRELLNILRSSSGLSKIFELKFDRSAIPVILKDYHLDPGKGTLLHADLIRISMNKPTRVRVPVELVGESVDVKNQGGIIEFASHHLEVECLPRDIPEKILVDITELKIGEHISVKDLDLDEKLKVMQEPDRLIVGALASRVEEVKPEIVEEEVAEEAAPSETETEEKPAEA